MKYYYEINAWFPKNVVFVNAKAFDALPPAAAAAVIEAAAAAEARGWALSARPQAERHEELRRHGMKIERVPRRARRRAQAPGRALLTRMGTHRGPRGQRRSSFPTTSAR